MAEFKKYQLIISIVFICIFILAIMIFAGFSLINIINKPNGEDVGSLIGCLLYLYFVGYIPLTLIIKDIKSKKASS